jgi:hypothetical protein
MQNLYVFLLYIFMKNNDKFFFKVGLTAPAPFFRIG